MTAQAAGKGETRRQRFAKTLRHEMPQSVIVDLGGCPLSGMEGDSQRNLLRHLGYEGTPAQQLPYGRAHNIDERILTRFDIDTRACGWILRPQDSQYRRISEEEYIDEWGIRYRHTGLYWEAVEHPLEGATLDDLKRYRFPDPASIDPAELDAIEARARWLYEETDYVVCAEHPVYGVFELGCWLCGFEDFLLRTAEDEAFVHALFDIILDYQLKVTDAYYRRVGPYAHYTSSGDDFATQNGPFISPASFRHLVFPYLEERISATKRWTQAAFLHHSCGGVAPLIEDLLAIGVDILNPIQPKARGMHPEALKQQFGGRIVFHGGLDTQEILPFCDEERIADEVRNLMDIMSRDGGYIFAAAHNIQQDVMPAKLVAMLDAAKAYRKRRQSETSGVPPSPSHREGANA